MWGLGTRLSFLKSVLVNSTWKLKPAGWQVYTGCEFQWNLQVRILPGSLNGNFFMLCFKKIHLRMLVGLCTVPLG